MLVKEKLEQREKFSDLEKIIANYILEKAEKIKVETVRSIADKTYSSPSSVMRFFQKIGYEGYNEFKEEYLKELKYLSSHFQNINPNFPFQNNDKNVVVANKISTLYQETLLDTLSLVDHDSLQQAINILRDSEDIYIIASGAQVGLCDVFKDKMMKIGKTVVIYHSEQDLYYEACYTNPKNCFIIISYSGETPKPLKSAPKLIERKIPTIVITSFGNNTLSNMFDCCLYVSTREKLISKIGNYSLNLSVLYVLDVLYSNYFNLAYDDNYKNKVKNSIDFENHRFSQNPILKEEHD
ncbi:MAG: MurR/RpiR family transcriptional regulator [Coprobacillaceae bacterium]